MKKASPTWRPCFRIKILRTIFEQGHTRNNLVKLFQILISGFVEDFLKISSCPYSAKSPPPAMFFQQIKILLTIFEKGHPRNIPVKLFLNLTRRFRVEDILRISSCPFGAKSLPPSPFKKGHTRNNLVKLFQILTSGFGDFLRISSCPYSAESLPPTPAAMFLDGSKFRKQFLRRVTQGTIL